MKTIKPCFTDNSYNTSTKFMKKFHFLLWSEEKINSHIYISSCILTDER